MLVDKNTIEFLPKPTHPNFKDHTGKTFNRLTFLGYAGRNKRNQPVWFIECECGKISISHATDIVTGHTKSCGCFRVETSTVTSTTHGMRHTPEYTAFNHAKDRCERPSDKRYEGYGGRGIEFRFATFDEFFAEVGLRPSNKHSLNRIDNDGHYEKGNIEWATKETQANNTRANKFWTYNGKTQTHIKWCREFGISHPCLVHRLKAGWSTEKAFTTPARKHSISLKSVSF